MSNGVRMKIPASRAKILAGAAYVGCHLNECDCFIGFTMWTSPEQNQSWVFEFLLLGFSSDPSSDRVLFIAFLLLYLSSVLIINPDLPGHVAPHAYVLLPLHPLPARYEL